MTAPAATRPIAATRRQDRPAWWRLPFLAAGFAALFAGMHGGLARLGWAVPMPVAEIAAAHGALMVSGFFGTLISLERAVALGRPWAYAAPAAAGLGSLSLFAAAPWPVAPLLFTAAAALLGMASLHVVRRQLALFTLVLAAGAATWLVGNLLWLAGAAMPDVVPWWSLFFLLTIAGERLELTRLAPPKRHAPELFAVLAGGLVLAAALAPVLGTGLLALGWLGLAAWLAIYDIARQTVRRTGLPRFTAVCLLVGYGWLALAGLIVLAAGLEPGTVAYDAALHALFLGFVFAMVFGHAPIIFPAILRRAMPFEPAFYLPLVALNLSLAVRLIGDVAGDELLRQHGGLGNAATIILFVVVVVRSLMRGTRPNAARHAA